MALTFFRIVLIFFIKIVLLLNSCLLFGRILNYNKRFLLHCYFLFFLLLSLILFLTFIFLFWRLFVSLTVLTILLLYVPPILLNIFLRITIPTSWNSFTTLYFWSSFTFRIPFRLKILLWLILYWFLFNRSKLLIHLFSFSLL